MIEVYIEKVYDADLEGITDDPHSYDIYTKSSYGGSSDFICECLTEDDANWLKALIEDNYKCHNELMTKINKEN